MNFIEVDAKAIYDEMIITFQQVLGEVLYPGDERRIFLEQETQIVVALYNAINESAKQNLLRYAKGSILDAIGEEHDTYRLAPQKAKCIVRFTLSSPQMNSIVIQKGTRVTPDGMLFFETNKESLVISGQTYVDIEAIATLPGKVYNDFTPGQLKTLVDPIPFIGQVSNITITSGGADEEADDYGDIWSGYRERIRLSGSKISTAGHELGYIYHAKSSDTNISDVVITSPNPGEILITVLMQDGMLPEQPVLQKVLDACSSTKSRPMTDRVSAQAPTQVTYDIQLTYYISQANRAEELSIKESVVDAIESYQKWQGTKIGQAINPDYLRQLVLNAGAYKVDVVSPSYVDIGETEIAETGDKSITYGGLK